MPSTSSTGSVPITVSRGRQCSEAPVPGPSIASISPSMPTLRHSSVSTVRPSRITVTRSQIAKISAMRWEM